MSKKSGVQQKNKIQKIRNGYSKRVKPFPARLMKILRLDKVYHRAEGAYLYYLSKRLEYEILDCIGGYGTLILGHNPPTLVDAIKDHLDSRAPIFSQLSVPSEATLFAKDIVRQVKRSTGRPFILSFTNSGSEAVEAAIKHSLLAYHNKIQAFRDDFKCRWVTISNRLSQEWKFQPFIFEDQVYTDFQEALQRLAAFNEQLIAQFTPSPLALESAYHGLRSNK